MSPPLVTTKCKCAAVSSSHQTKREMSIRHATKCIVILIPADYNTSQNNYIRTFESWDKEFNWFSFNHSYMLCSYDPLLCTPATPLLVFIHSFKSSPCVTDLCLDLVLDIIRLFRITLIRRGPWVDVIGGRCNTSEHLFPGSFTLKCSAFASFTSLGVNVGCSNTSKSTFSSFIEGPRAWERGRTWTVFS